MTLRIRTAKYLSGAGAFTLLLGLIAVCVVAYTGYEVYLNGYSEEGVFIWIMLFPLAVGTGLLTAAREGRYDLLFGARVTRSRVLLVALARCVGIAVVVAVILGALSVQDHQLVLTVALRSLSVALFTGGCCFAAGLLEPRYALGVVWIVVRIVSLLTRAGFTLYHQLAAVRHGGALPPTEKLFLLAVAFPEVALRVEMPIVIVVALGILGLAAIAAAFAVLARAELPGRRSA